MAEQAVAYRLKAGKQALKRSANLEALIHLGKGLDLVTSLPDSERRMRRELHLQNAMGVALMATRGRGAPEVLHALTQARSLCEKLGDTNQLFITLCGQSGYHRNTGNFREADKLGHQSLELARASGDPALLIEAHHLLWAVKTLMGDYAAAETHVNFGIATYDPDRHHSLTYIYSGHDPGVCCRTWCAELLWLRGYLTKPWTGAKRPLPGRTIGSPKHLGAGAVELLLGPSQAARTQRSSAMDRERHRAVQRVRRAAYGFP
jgi:hypothetical protein